MSNVIHLRTAEAAALLGVRPNTLRDWEERYDFPHSQATASGHRQFVWGEIIALRRALLTEHSVASAIVHARASLTGSDAESLCRAFANQSRSECEAVLTEAQRSRSLEGTVESVLVGAVDMLGRTHLPGSPAWEFATTFSLDWLASAGRYPPPAGGGRILLGNGSRGHDADAIYIRSLELLCERIGCRVQTVPIRTIDELHSESLAAAPDVLLIAGAQAADELVVRWTYEARRSVLPATTAFYRRDPRGLGFVSASGKPLPSDPLAARSQLLELIERAHSAA